MTLLVMGILHKVGARELPPSTLPHAYRAPDGLVATLRLAEIELLRLKPAGRAARAGVYDALRCSDDQHRALREPREVGEDHGLARAGGVML